MSTTLTIEIKAPEVAAAINHLADAISTGNLKVPETSAQSNVSNVAPVTTQPAPQTVAPTQMTPPVQQVAPAVIVPTSVLTYDIMTLANACAPLMDAGKQSELQQLLHQFGANMLGELQPAQYGAFAEAIRRMGAKI